MMALRHQSGRRRQSGPDPVRLSTSRPKGDAIVSESSTSSLRVETRSESDRLIIVLRGDVDMATAPQFDAVARQAVDEGATDIELDAAELGFMDSTGLSVIASLIRHLRPSGERLIIRNGPPLLVKLLEITALREHIDLVDEKT